MESVGIFFGPLVCFTAIWNILLSFGIFWVRLEYFLPVLVCFTKKNLATLDILQHFKQKG
jgi:hypothetical protein